MYFLFSDYSATGEGRTISILITYLHPKKDDYEIQPHFEEQRDENGHLVFNHGILKTPVEDILRNAFAEEFDAWTAMGIEILEKKEFLTRASKFLPELVVKFIEEPMGNLRYSSQFYYNFS